MPSYLACFPIVPPLDVDYGTALKSNEGTNPLSSTVLDTFSIFSQYFSDMAYVRERPFPAKDLS